MATREEPIECTQSPYSLRVITVSCPVYCHTPAPLQQCRAFALSVYSSVDQFHWPRGSCASSKFSRMQGGRPLRFVLANFVRLPHTHRFPVFTHSTNAT